MARRVVSLNDGEYRRTRAMRQSERGEPIKWTRGPDTRARRAARNLWG